MAVNPQPSPDQLSDADRRGTSHGLRPVAGTEVGIGERAAGPYGPVAHEQDGRPVRPDRDSPAAPEDRHHR
ncbi:hypothetical protein DLJ59_07790 [Micromonospora inaquosa]|uniref:Uncharacterized protein n=1 Tax=Micromonospora inaquosa TaxID=2203716 RepID=A0A3N9WX40_9ACTN|nr:hypothetical protein DLJ59_07790 [Micromonospora inaquosa]